MRSGPAGLSWSDSPRLSELEERVARLERLTSRNSGHDASGEFLARDMKIEVTTGSYGEAAHEALQRAAGPASEW